MSESKVDIYLKLQGSRQFPISAATYLYVRERANYADARRLCQKHDLDLAKVTTDEDQHNLSELIKKVRSVETPCASHFRITITPYYISARTYFLKPRGVPG